MLAILTVFDAQGTYIMMSIVFPFIGGTVMYHL